ncbi:MAG TPA: hypothetical protein VH540_06605 [Ktedonobacterales bacterium]|jgi:CheY-like chemotaxis protein
MWQALVVTTDADLLEMLRDQLEAPGYAVVEAGTVSDADQLLHTSDSCLFLLLTPLLSSFTNALLLAPTRQDTRLVSPSAYLLLAANPPSQLSTSDLALPSPVITIITPESLEELLACMEHAANYLGMNPLLLTAPQHSGQGRQLDESSEQR